MVIHLGESVFSDFLGVLARDVPGGGKRDNKKQERQ